MIRLESEPRRLLGERLQHEGGWTDADPPELVARLLSTVHEPTFPGAIVPRLTGDRVQYYLLASSEPDWRLLGPLAMASVGRTLSSFDGSKSTFSSEDSFEQLVLEAGLIGALVHATGPEREDRRRVGTALDEMRALASAAPAHKADLRTTASLLSDFRLALAARDRSAAANIIDRLRGDLRLDGLNQVFMRIEVDAVLEAWEDLWTSHYFVDACRALRPPRVTAGLARATYWIALSEAAEAGDVVRLRETFLREVAPRAQGLFAGLPPADTPDVVLPFLLGWDLADEGGHTSDGLRSALASWTGGQRTCASNLLDTLESRTVPRQDSPSMVTTGSGGLIDTADIAALRDLVFAAVMRPSTEAVNVARLALDTADPAAITSLRGSELYRDALEMVLAHDIAPAIVTWVDWARQISPATQIYPDGWARSAAEERPIWLELQEPERLAEFVTHLDRAMGLDPRATSLELPLVLDAVISDPEWPRPAFQPLYRSLLDLVVLDDSVSQSKVAAVSRLTGGILAAGVDRGDYARIARDLGEWVTRASSLTTLDRLIDLGELTVTYPCPDEPARRALWAMIVLAFRPYEERLDAVQRSVLHDVDRMIGGDVRFTAMLDRPVVAVREPAAEGPVAPPGGQRARVAIYSLVESMAKRTRAILEASYPSIEVQLSMGTVADKRLEQQAREADLFVICWARATHAATNAIRARRGDKPLLYASGAGSASLTREIVEKLVTIGVNLGPAQSSES